MANYTFDLIAFFNTITAGMNSDFEFDPIVLFRNAEPYELDAALQSTSENPINFPIIVMISDLTNLNQIIRSGGQGDVTINCFLIFAYSADYATNSNIDNDYWNDYITPAQTLANKFLKTLRGYELNNIEVDKSNIQAKISPFKDYEVAANKISGITLDLSFTIKNVLQLC